MVIIQQETKSRPIDVFDSLVHREKQPLWRPTITVDDSVGVGDLAIFIPHINVINDKASVVGIVAWIDQVLYVGGKGEGAPLNWRSHFSISALVLGLS